MRLGIQLLAELARGRLGAQGREADPVDPVAIGHLGFLDLQIQAAQKTAEGLRQTRALNLRCLGRAEGNQLHRESLAVRRGSVSRPGGKDSTHSRHRAKPTQFPRNKISTSLPKTRSAER